MNPLWQAVIGAVAVVGGGAGVWSLLTLGATKRKLVAEAESLNAATVSSLSKSALELMEPLRARVHELEAEAREARKEASEAREEISTLRTTVADLTAVLRAWRTAIIDPNANVEALRAMVATENGRPLG